jgi:hypothetical protein
MAPPTGHFTTLRCFVSQEIPVAETNEPEYVSIPLDLDGFKAWLRKPVAPKYLDRRLESINREGFTLVLFVAYERLK